MIKKWFKALSPVTLLSAFSSVTLGTAIAWYKTGKIIWAFYFITLIALILAQAGVNLINDYIDYKTNIDLLYRKTGLFHRNNAIVDLNLNPKIVRSVGYSMIFIALLSGIYLALRVGIPVIVIGIIGLFLGVIYSEPPFNLKYRGYGEIIAAIVMGPLVVWGSYIVQTGNLSTLYPLLVGIINGSFTFLILLGSSSLKAETYKKLNKKNIIIVMGNKIRYVVYSAIGLLYLSIILSSLFDFIPLIALISLIFIPNTLKLTRPLLKIEDVNKKWDELRQLWAGPFSARILILIIIIVSIIITRFIRILDISIF
ncbi:1,4-dihydroxy-2-naphthoate octaprenyltransferase [Caldisphaera lagunensis DSM 15908]|uniref:1,4-dihydroxy-2-naphthoate octaprenyltransferase n=1 Tax=Caldisphaera lagunensis (strain DSM 15908 / JCM 11604 / ANMR 0165 / IC-154) TaxID=1056495 RepID=L0A7Y7_CALLD|nr:prenyltransferase [Caldisphaera lagunensis]AFZ69946.1 1,4-dihydroxy-2-naphthoate octaprenyltransferase [Caldisphaera lagunensis DSM 15908]